ncbi:MAG: M20/M25/M40 family metallo-hydrolase [Flavobacteriaceae bacterium]
MKTIFSTVLALLLSFTVTAQKTNAEDSIMLRKIFDEALLDGKSYEWLRHITKNIGHRLSGSVGAEKAVAYAKEELEKLDLDKVWLQSVMVPKWVRGIQEYAYIETSSGNTTVVNIRALGGSTSTPVGGLKAGIIEVQGIEGLKKLSRSDVEGKIVFFNKAMDPRYIETFGDYGNTVSQRSQGAYEASKLGAVGVILRSVTLKEHETPHGGGMSYRDLPLDQYIPAAAISTSHANLLSSMLRLQPDLQFYFNQTSKMLPDVESHNVIGEIKGSVHPERIILVGAHIDSWDLGEGAHDDGAGVVQSMEVMRMFKNLNYTPKHTIRIVLFMNEENGTRGAKKYAEEAEKNKEPHIFGIESDAGGFSPRGFSIAASDEEINHLKQWQPLFEPYLTDLFVKGFSGVDIRPLEKENNIMAGLKVDSQRYFDIHHAETDVFELVSKRELELGGAAMASIIYLVDKYGTVNYPVE